MPAPSLHQPFDEAEGVLSEEEVSSSPEELDVEKNAATHKSVLVYSELELCIVLCLYKIHFSFLSTTLSYSYTLYFILILYELNAIFLFPSLSFLSLLQRALDATYFARLCPASALRPSVRLCMRDYVATISPVSIGRFSPDFYYWRILGQLN